MVSIRLIGVTTFLFGFAGFYIGHPTGTFLESKAELLGGLIPIAVGIKVLVEHVGRL